MRRLRQYFLEQSTKLKMWQRGSLTAVILGSSIIWGIHKTESLKGFWGLKDDEIAVVTIEEGKNGKTNLTIKDPSKSFWDVLELLGVPLVLAILGAWFQQTQQEQSERLSKEQREQDADEKREEVLQLYFDRISTLLIDNNLMSIAIRRSEALAARAKGVFTSSSNIEQAELLEVAINIIQARTLSILRRFEQDQERKSSVIRFLIEADIVKRLKISLSRTNLSDTNLRDADLSNASLNDANLIKAYLKGSRLVGANLRGAWLHGANLSRANLSEANLHGANLPGADLTWATLRDVNLSEANLLGADLLGADLSHANLKGAYLKDADLTGAYLDTANVAFASFGIGRGLSEGKKQYLIQRGAVFEDALEDHESSPDHK